MNPRYRSLTLEDLIKILYSAEAKHVLLYGRRMGFADDLSEKIASSVAYEYTLLSDSEIEVITEEIEEYLSRRSERPPLIYNTTGNNPSWSITLSLEDGGTDGA